MTDYNPAQAHLGVLYPCHSLILQFYVSNKNLSVKMYQRSADAFLGLPFNIASTSLLLCIISKLTNLNPYEVTITLGDCHIYEEHYEAVKTQLNRSCYCLPKIEIPDFTKIPDINKNKKFVAFSQKMFMYKLNLQNLRESNWIGSKITKKKYISSMQALRNLKFKNYPFWRVDKYNQQIIKGGWHFSFLQSPQQILTKIKSFSHGEFNTEEVNEKNIQEKILKNKDIFGRDTELKKIPLDESYPEYIFKNKERFSDWIA